MSNDEASGYILKGYCAEVLLQPVVCRLQDRGKWLWTAQFIHSPHNGSRIDIQNMQRLVRMDGAMVYHQFSTTSFDCLFNFAINWHFHIFMARQADDERIVKYTSPGAQALAQSFPEVMHAVTATTNLSRWCVIPQAQSGALLALCSQTATRCKSNINLQWVQSISFAHTKPAAVFPGSRSPPPLMTCSDFETYPFQTK